MSGTTIDNEWQQVMQRVTANENEWSSQLKFFCQQYHQTSKHNALRAVRGFN